MDNVQNLANDDVDDDDDDDGDDDDGVSTEYDCTHHQDAIKVD